MFTKESGLPAYLRKVGRVSKDLLRLVSEQSEARTESSTNGGRGFHSGFGFIQSLLLSQTTVVGNGDRRLPETWLCGESISASCAGGVATGFS